MNEKHGLGLGVSFIVWIWVVVSSVVYSQHYDFVTWLDPRPKREDQQLKVSENLHK